MGSMQSLPMDYTVIDIETTGFSITENKIIEVAAIRTRNGVVVARFDKLIRIDEQLPRKIVSLTGITDNMLCNAEPIKDALSAFFAFLGEDVIVGHNIGYFDIPFINRASSVCIGATIKNECIDTLPLSKELLPELCSHGLEHVAEALDVAYVGAHRAINDCDITYRCFERFRKFSIPKDFPLFSRNEWSGNETEEVVLNALNEILGGATGEDTPFYVEERSSDYLSCFSPSGGDFCRIKVGPKAHWISLDLWACPNQRKNDPRFDFVKKKSVRHWKIPLGTPFDVYEYEDIIKEAYFGNRNRRSLAPAEENAENKYKTWTNKGNWFDYRLDYTAISMATTGLNYLREEIVSISALRVRNGIVVGQFDSLLACDKKFPVRFSETTKITDAMLDSAPKAKTVMHSFKEFIGNDILVECNRFKFCAEFLNTYFQEYLGCPHDNEHLDISMLTCLAKLPTLENNPAYIAENLGITCENTNTNLTLRDCNLTNSCYLRMREMILERARIGA